MKIRKTLMLLSFVLLAWNNVNCQTCCSGGTPLLGNLGINGIEPGTVYFQLAYDYNYLDDLYAGRELLDDNTRERLTQTALLQVVYPFSEKMSVNGLFTYVGQQRTIFTETGQANVTETNGLGDAVLLLQYSVLSVFKRSLVLAAGPKLPIGKFDATDDEFGLVVSPDLQPGSGSLDGIFGASYQESQILKITGLSFNASASYRLTTPAKRFEGDIKYRFGNESMLSLGLQKNFLIKKIGVTPSVFTQYRHTSADKTDGLTVAGTGGDWIYISPGLNLELSNNLSINAAAELPVYRNLKGTQLTTSYRFNVGLAIKLFKN